MNQNQSFVNHFVRPAHGAAARQPSVADFLRYTPLPKKLRHIEPVVRRLKSVRLLIQIVVNGAAAGCTDAEIANGLKQAANFGEQDTHHCAACLKWLSAYHAVCLIDGGAYHFFAMCEPCQTRIERGNGTAQMAANLRNYISGGAE